MADILALVLHHDEPAVPVAVDLALSDGVAGQDPWAEPASHRLVDGMTTGNPPIDTPQALIPRREPRADVERHDDLRARHVGGRHAS